jgi:hypothetical protein
MVLIVFLGLQNLNDSLHFALQITNNFFFLFMQNYLWSSSMKGMASHYGACICGLGGVYVGLGRKLVLHWPGFFKEPRFNSPTSDWFCKKFLHLWDKFVIGKINSKSWECIPNFCTYPTYPMISLTLKTGKCISTK